MYRKLEGTRLSRATFDYTALHSCRDRHQIPINYKLTSHTFNSGLLSSFFALSQGQVDDETTLPIDWVLPVHLEKKIKPKSTHGYLQC